MVAQEVNGTSPDVASSRERSSDVRQVRRTYQVRTYGCQMNVHDSERLAGLLEAAGYERAVELDRRRGPERMAPIHHHEQHKNRAHARQLLHDMLLPG